MKILPSLTRVLPARLQLGTQPQANTPAGVYGQPAQQIRLDSLDSLVSQHAQAVSRAPAPGMPPQDGVQQKHGWDRLNDNQRRWVVRGLWTGAAACVIGVIVAAVVKATHHEAVPSLRNLPPAPNPTWLGPTNQTFVNGVNGSFWDTISGRADARAACNFTSDAVSTPDNALALSIMAGNYGLHDQGCGELDSNKTFLHGAFSVNLKAAKQDGVVTQAFTYVEVIPNYNSEIDIKILGNDTSALQAIAWRDGTPTATRVPLGFDASQDFHEYAFAWNNDSVVWSVDGKDVATMNNVTLMPRAWPAPFIVNTWLSTSKGGEAGDYDNATTVDAASEFRWVDYTPFS